MSRIVITHPMGPNGVPYKQFIGTKGIVEVRPFTVVKNSNSLIIWDFGFKLAVVETPKELMSLGLKLTPAKEGQG